MNQVLTLRQHASLLIRWWWLPLASGLMGFLTAVFYLSSATPIYKATAIVGPRQTAVSTQRGGNLGLGGLLSTLQGSPANMEMARADVFWRSERLATAISRSDELLQRLMPDRWDAESQRWRPSSALNARLSALFGLEQPERPTIDDIQAALRKRFRSDIQLQSFRELSIRSSDPQAAVELLRAIIDITGDEFRTDDLQEVDRLLTYSIQRMDEVSIPRQSEVLAQIVMLLEQQRMQVEASQYYLFDIVQEPTPDALPISPKPMLALAAGALLPAALVGGLLLILPGYSGRKRG
ncbi:MAG: hypothetical protein SNJ63_09735 [Sphingomonadaceae bacterium]